MTARVVAPLCVLLMPLVCVAEERRDAAGDPLPQGALVRLGTTRWRNDNGFGSLACTRDGKWVLGLCHAQLWIWDAATGKRVGTIPANNFPGPQRLALAPDDRRAAFNHDGAVVICDLPDGKLRHALKRPEAQHSPLAFSPDGGLLATDTSGKLFLWDTTKGRLRAEVPWPGGRPHCAVFSRDGKALYACRENDTPRRVDTTAERPEAVPWLEGERGRNLALSPDGKTLAVCAAPPPNKRQDPHTLLLVDLPEGRVRQRLAGPKDGLFPGLAFTSDGQKLVVCVSHQLSVYDLAAGTDRTHRETSAGFFSLMAVAPDGKTLYTNYGHRIRRWRLPALEEIDPVDEEGSPTRVRYAPSGSVLFAAYGAGPVRLWDTKSGKHLHALPYALGESRHVAFTPDGRSVIGSYAPGTHTRKNQPLGFFSWDVKTGELSPPLVPNRVGYFATTADGRLLACTTEEQRVELWDLGKRERVTFLPRPKEAVEFTYPLAFTPDGRVLAHYTNKQGLMLWDHQAGVSLTLENSQEVNSDTHIDFSPDGLLIVGRVYGHYGHHLWDATTGRLIAKASQPASLGTVRFTRDGRGMVFSDDKSLKLYDLAEGRFVRELPTGNNNHWCFDLSPDRKTVATGMTDGTVMIWDAAEFLKPLPRTVQDLPEDEMLKLWEALGSDNAKTAFRARWRLASAKGAAAFLKGKLLSGKAPPADEVAAAIAALDDDRFEVRERATRQLEQWGERVEPALARALAADPPSLEARRRLEGLMARMAGLPAGPGPGRAVRGVAALEAVGDAEARALLKSLADGAEGLRLAAAARAALQRLGDD